MDVHDPEQVVALCGSVRDGSRTRHALEETLAAAERKGASTDLVDLSTRHLPMFDPNRRDAGDANELRQLVSNADAVVLGTPMYHGSYSSVLKTALDYCRAEEFEGTTVGLLVVAGGGFPTPALEHLRSVARTLGAWVLPNQVAIPDARSTVEAGAVTDEALRERIATLGSDLVDYAGVQSYPERSTACAVPTAE